MFLMLKTISCQSPRNEVVVTPSKFGEKFKNLHKTIVIRKPGVYDYKGVMHIWKGEGNCTVFGAKYPVMEIHADNVTVRNFGYKDATVGIVVSDKESGEARRSVVLENIEGLACREALELPRASQNVMIKDSIFRVTE